MGVPDPSSDYSHWVRWLEAFASGAEEALEGLPHMDPARLGGPTAARFADRCGDALNKRLRHWSDSFQRDIDRAKDVNALRDALRAGRHRLALIWSFAESPLLFADLRKALSDGLQRVVDATQQTLEDHAHRDNPKTREELLRIVRANPINKRMAIDVTGPERAQRTDSLVSPTGPRTVILGPSGGSA